MRMLQLRLQILVNDLCKGLQLPHCKVRLEQNSDTNRGIYHMRWKDITIFQCVNGKVQSYEQLIEAINHELAHHYQFIKYGQTNHDEQFKEILKMVENSSNNH